MAQPADGCPPNLDFELGNFSGWQCYTGTITAGTGLITLNPSPPTVNRHEIMNINSGNDAFGSFPKLCPYGGAYSVKLGNEVNGAQAEGLSFTFTVPNTPGNDFALTYYYAVVFEDNGHPPAQQPRFKVKCTDISGNLISCANYDFIAAGNIPGFQTSPLSSIVRYKAWTPNTIDFTGLSGTQVKLEFTTTDCSQSGHFGYAYIDIATNCNSILATGSVCAGGGGELILNAPSGLQSYTWWDGGYTTIIGTTQNITMNPSPPLGTVFHVDMVPYPGYGCRDTADAVVTLVQPPDTPTAQTNYNYCQNATATQLTATASSGNYLQWYNVPAGGIPSLNAPVPSTTTPGVFYYYVAQKNPQSCESVRKRITVRVSPTPVVSFSTNNNRQCIDGNSFIFTSTSTGIVGGANTTYEWDFGDGNTGTGFSTTYAYTTPGSYNVQLKVTNLPTCVSTISLPVTVVDKPIAAFTYPDTICETFTPVIVVDQSYTPGTAASAVNNWYWNIGGAISLVQSPPSFSASAGDLVMKLAVKNADGCLSDTTTETKRVKHNPVSKFNYTRVQCDNEVIYFTDQSFITSADADEKVNTWDWQLSNGVNAATQNVQSLFPAGPQRARLKATTNFGCAGGIADSGFVIYGKPLISVSVNDSCVNRLITFSANDLSNSVSNWWWNFGGGWYQAPAAITKTFTGDGYKPFKVTGQTVFGCKDTVFVPFTTYANYAKAGNDTIVTRNQPVQLNATGGTQYLWTPATGLNNPAIANPIATYNQDVYYNLHVISKEGCDSYDNILVKRYKGPELYVPTGFTPNGDGKNDVLKVFPVGIKTFGSFSVYDRNGIRVFYTQDYNRGWDGRIKGREAESGTYVFIADGINYLGAKMEVKGSVILIR